MLEVAELLISIGAVAFHPDQFDFGAKRPREGRPEEPCAIRVLEGAVAD